ncbi:substrate-binding periplasmic protein [Motiliproteus sp.]|uniref:substrate-binding periplasmic protein n=1 Tax=Motiliproteus sp. TaxID=1898955 RepID=UPI003BAAF499
MANPRAQGRALLIVLTFALLSIRVAAEPLTLYTEEFPPFNFTQQGEMQGVSTQIIKALMQQAGFSYRIVSHPWSRSFKQAQTEPNALIYSISRNPEREALFKWIGVLVPASHSIFALRSRTDIRIEQLSDLQQYRIATQQNGARESYLLQNGLSEQLLLRLSGDQVPLQQYQLLSRGRIDLWPAADAVAHHLLKSQGQDPERLLRRVYSLKSLSAQGYYLAASPNSSPELIAQLRDALIRLKQTPRYQQILRNWGMTPATSTH